MMKSEIGSEFWTGCTPLNGNGVGTLLPAGMDVRFTLCGRTALELVLRDAVRQRNIRRAYLPSYCCHTMIEPFTPKGIEVVFYDVFFTDTGIGWDFREDNGCDLVFLMDYFGFRNAETTQIAAAQKTLGKCVVYDATHSMFCEGMDYTGCDYVFGSFRKWMDVNAGFCAKQSPWQDFPALAENRRYAAMRNGAFLHKQRYLSGESVDKAGFLRAFNRAEEMLETDYLAYAPDAESLEKLAAVDVEFIRSRRRGNAHSVIRSICALQSLEITSPYKAVGNGDCPLFVPVQVAVQHRSLLRGDLIGQSIYLPIHWPLSDLHRTNAVSQGIYDTELSFLCDQRYTPRQLQRMTYQAEVFARSLL